MAEAQPNQDNLEENEDYRVLKGNYEFLKDFLNQLITREVSSDDRIEQIVCDTNDLIKDYLFKIKDMKENKSYKCSNEDEDSDEEGSVSVGGEVFKDCFGEDIKPNTLEILLKKLDNRMVPPLDSFKEEDDLDLAEYLKRFEEYYEANYKCSKMIWVEELSKKLEGRILEGYRSVKQKGDRYEEVKKKLLIWYNEENEVRRESARRMFNKAQFKPSETMLRYCNRLLALFRRAYPKKNAETSNTLISQLRKTLPKQMKQIIDSQILSAKMDDKKITWSRINKIARIYDLDNIEKVTEDNEEDVIEINLGNSRHLKGEDYSNGDRNYRKQRNQDNKFSKKFDPRNKENNNSSQFREAPKFKKCNYCKRSGHEYDECRARLGLCFICGKKGHTAQQCWNKRPEFKKEERQRRQQSVSPTKNGKERKFFRSRSHQVNNDRNSSGNSNGNNENLN